LRILRYVYEKEGLSALGVVGNLSPVLKEDLDDMIEALQYFISRTGFYSFLDRFATIITVLNTTVKRVNNLLKTIPSWLRALLMKIGIFKLIEVVLKTIGLALTLINILVKVRSTFVKLNNLCVALRGEFANCKGIPVSLKKE
jgi:hypothetical protein